MGNKKDIGSVFREKLGHLDASPSDNGWAALNAELDKKEKKRRLLPLWFWYVGLFSVGILVTGLIYTNMNSKNNLQKIEDDTSKNNKSDLDENSITSNGAINYNETKIANTIEENSKEATLNENSKSTKNSIKTVNNTLTTNEKSNENASNKNKKNYSKTNSVSKNKRTITSKRTKSNAFKSKSGNYLVSKIKNKSKSKISKSNSAKDKNDAILLKSISENSEILKNFEESATQQNSKLAQNENAAKNEFLNSIIESEQLTAKEKSIVKDSNKKKKIVAEKPKDSVPIQDSINRGYTVFVYGSPTAVVFANKNSYLDDRLKNNSKTTELTLSYGAYLCFEGSEKFSIRLGVGKNNLKLLTKNIPINTFNYSNIGYSNGFSNAIIFSKSNNSSSMNITQNLSYYDVPVEMKYKIMNRKIGLNVILGANFIFLDKNEVFAETDSGFSSKIGETSNLLKNTFGASASLGVDYKITKKIKINVEPMLKYQFKNSQIDNSYLFDFNILTGLEFKIFNKK